MNKTTDIRSSLVDSAANWDSIGKTKLLKLAEAAAASVPQTEWGMQMSALQGRVDLLDQSDQNNQIRLINGTNLGDETDMSISLKTYQYTGPSTPNIMVRGEFFVRGGTSYPLGDDGAGIAIRTSEPVTQPFIWAKWEESGGESYDHYYTVFAVDEGTVSPLLSRNLNVFRSARLSFLCAFKMAADSEVTIWPEFITADLTGVANMFVPGSYIQTAVQFDKVP